MNNIRRTCINMLIEEMLRDEYYVRHNFILSIIGGGQSVKFSLLTLSDKELMDEVYETFQPWFTKEEEEIFQEDDEALGEWIMERSEGCPDFLKDAGFSESYLQYLESDRN